MASGWIAALFWATALAGLGLLLRRDRRLGLYTLTVAAGHGIGILILSPLGLASPTIFGRYLLPVLPFVLLWAAAASARPGGEGAGPRPCSWRRWRRRVRSRTRGPGGPRSCTTAISWPSTARGRRWPSPCRSSIAACGARPWWSTRG